MTPGGGGGGGQGIAMARALDRQVQEISRQNMTSFLNPSSSYTCTDYVFLSSLQAFTTITVITVTTIIWTKKQFVHLSQILYFIEGCVCVLQIYLAVKNSLINYVYQIEIHEFNKDRLKACIKVGGGVTLRCTCLLHTVKNILGRIKV